MAEELDRTYRISNSSRGQRLRLDDSVFGYRFIAGGPRGCGITPRENRVARLCSQKRIWSIFAKK